MYHLVDNLQSRTGDALAGYYVKLKNTAGAYATLYADENLTPIINESGVADAGITDDQGMYDIYVEDGVYDIEFFDPNDSTLLRSSVPGVYLFSLTGRFVHTAADRDALAEVDPTLYTTVQMQEDLRAGTFVWSDADLETEVTADPEQGVYVAPDSDATGASGAWIRVYDGPVNPKWFGVVGGADHDGFAGAPDDQPALQAWIDYCLAFDLPLICQERIMSKILDSLTIAPTGNLVIPFIGVQASPYIDLANLTLIYNGTRDRVVLTIGNNTTMIANTVIKHPKMIAYGALQWPMAYADMIATPDDYRDDGIRHRYVQKCVIHESMVYGFSKNLEYENVSWCTVHGSWNNLDSQLCRVWTTSTASTGTHFTNQNIILGGEFQCTSNATALGNAFADVFTWDKVSSYRGQNANTFIGVSYEMAALSSASLRVPVWFHQVGGNNNWIKARQENCEGPFAICDGGLNGGAMADAKATNNNFDVSFNSSLVEQLEYVLQVNGAFGNIYTGPGADTHEWRSPDLVTLLSSSGGANSPYIMGPVFFIEHPTGTAVRTTTVAGVVATGIDSIVLGSAFVATAVDTTFIKTFRASCACRSDGEGRLGVFAFDSSGNRLTGNATDATWGNEPYVKGRFNLATTANFGGGWVSSTDGDAQDFVFTVRDEVKKIWVGYSGAPQQIALIGYSTPENVNFTDARAGMRCFADVADPGVTPLVTAKPDTAGTHGYHQKGTRVGNASAAAAAPAGYMCSTTGWLAAAWAAATAYTHSGRLVINDSGKVYKLVTAGTSAGSGGPTGTATGITDNTCVWDYVGVKAAYVTEANLA